MIGLKLLNVIEGNIRWLKSTFIRRFFGPHFLAFGLNTERYGISLCIQSECGKSQTRKTPNADTFHAVIKETIKLLPCGISNLAISKCGCKIFLYLRRSNDLFLKNFCLKFLDFINKPSPRLTRLRISVLRLSAQKYFLEYQVKPCVRYSLHSYPENLMIQEIKIYIISANKIINRRY